MEQFATDTLEIHECIAFPPSMLATAHGWKCKVFQQSMSSEFSSHRQRTAPSFVRAPYALTPVEEANYVRSKFCNVTRVSCHSSTGVGPACVCVERGATRHQLLPPCKRDWHTRHRLHHHTAGDRSLRPRDAREHWPRRARHTAWHREGPWSHHTE